MHYQQLNVGETRILRLVPGHEDETITYQLLIMAIPHVDIETARPNSYSGPYKALSYA
jgi:hypothetical protein